jgi:tryptophan synthase alpha chain
VLVGVGVSDAAQAVQACAVADGVIQGAAVMRRLLDEGPDSVARFVGEVRDALDASARDGGADTAATARRHD